MYMCFSKTPALSPTGEARPFDAEADGTILGEGLGVLVLKRLADARRDGDRVYAVIRAIGTSSDGKGQAVYAPSAAGQARALRQAYALAGVSPATVELVEAHGTGTKVGDATELAALEEVYREARPGAPWCALGSVKSQIGHTKAAAGAAGLIKAALALHHKVLPPTLKVRRPIGAAGARAIRRSTSTPRPGPGCRGGDDPAARGRQRLRLRRQQLPLRARGGRAGEAGDRLGRRRADPRLLGRRSRRDRPRAGRPGRPTDWPAIRAAGARSRAAFRRAIIAIGC